MRIVQRIAACGFAPEVDHEETKDSTGARSHNRSGAGLLPETDNGKGQKAEEEGEET
jgi:hypothetical protein